MWPNVRIHAAMSRKSFAKVTLTVDNRARFRTLVGTMPGYLSTSVFVVGRCAPTPRDDLAVFTGQAGARLRASKG